MNAQDNRKWQKLTELVDEGRTKRDLNDPLEIDATAISLLIAQSETIVLLEDIRALLTDVLSSEPHNRFELIDLPDKEKMQEELTEILNELKKKGICQNEIAKALGISTVYLSYMKTVIGL